ncbi:MAG: phosphatidylinositol-specific phospholipase C/glycerophosphodiester phosphodiesterase family protein [Limisphaerales bacterium]
MVTRSITLVIVGVFLRMLSFGAPVPLIHAHAHNDYEHQRPLFDALSHGFCSVEADIYLVNGELLVAHNRKDVKRERTLQALYLEPLWKLAKKNQGKIYGAEPRFFLLIDIKSDFATLYPVLRKNLEGYADILTRFENGKVRTNTVTVVLTGGYSMPMVAAETNRLAGVDGRLKDLSSTKRGDAVLWISDSWKPIFHWNGQGKMPDNERAVLRTVVERAHAEGKLVRFWAAPQTKETWSELAADGVDLLNADDLAGLEKFLLANPYPGTLLDAPLNPRF